MNATQNFNRNKFIDMLVKQNWHKKHHNIQYIICIDLLVTQNNEQNNRSDS